MEYDDPQETLTLLLDFLKFRGVLVDIQTMPWTIGKSPMGAGRGVVATRDVKAGELLFEDMPVVLGPRAGQHSSPLCVGCHRGEHIVQLQPCSKGCRLPVCSSTCENSQQHQFECNKLRSWGIKSSGTTNWSKDLLKSLTPVRCLQLSSLERRVLCSLQSHTGPHHGKEVNMLKQCLEDGPSEEEEELMRLACRVMDANAFETATLLTPDDPEQAIATSIRGLYPLGAMMNHECTPNTRHVFTSPGNKMVVHATVDIPAGAELTNSYTALIWGTPARRHHLSATKHFECACCRCADPTEKGSRLAALKCPVSSCPGCVLPEEPLKENSQWRCELCGRTMSTRKAATTTIMLARILKFLDNTNATQMERFLQEYHHIAPPSNQIVVEVKCSLLRLYGHGKHLRWSDLTWEQLELKEKLCRELLQLLETLGAGLCRMKGLLLYELHCVLMETIKRKLSEGGSNDENMNRDPKLLEAMKKEALNVIEESVSILREDLTAPLDIMHRYQQVKNMLAS